jgi:hypothetical protein
LHRTLQIIETAPPAIQAAVADAVAGLAAALFKVHTQLLHDVWDPRCNQSDDYAFRVVGGDKDRVLVTPSLELFRAQQQHEVPALIAASTTLVEWFWEDAGHAGASGKAMAAIPAIAIIPSPLAGDRSGDADTIADGLQRMPSDVKELKRHNQYMLSAGACALLALSDTTKTMIKQAAELIEGGITTDPDAHVPAVTSVADEESGLKQITRMAQLCNNPEMYGGNSDLP